MATPWSAVSSSHRGSDATARSSAPSAPRRSNRTPLPSPSTRPEQDRKHGTIPARDQHQGDTVTIHIFDPAKAGAPLPELSPLPIGALTVGALNLLNEAADLPDPVHLSISDTQAISVQFPPEQASLRAITKWALRFGGVVTSQKHQTPSGPQNWCRTEFSYYGVAIRAFAH